MITSAENRGWPGDVSVNDLELAGLPAPSVIRTAKIATIEISDATQLGRIAPRYLNKVVAKIGIGLGLAPEAAGRSGEGDVVRSL